MIEKLAEQVEDRFGELQQQMSDPDVIGDRERYAEVGRAYRELEPAHELVAEWRRLRGDLEGAEELLAEDGDDEELRRAGRRRRLSACASSRRRSASRWSSATPTTTRT